MCSLSVKSIECKITMHDIRAPQNIFQFLPASYFCHISFYFIFFLIFMFRLFQAHISHLWPVSFGMNAHFFVPYSSADVNNMPQAKHQILFSGA